MLCSELFLGWTSGWKIKHKINLYNSPILTRITAVTGSGDILLTATTTHVWLTLQAVDGNHYLLFSLLFTLFLSPLYGDILLTECVFSVSSDF